MLRNEQVRSVSIQLCTTDDVKMSQSIMGMETAAHIYSGHLFSNANMNGLY